MSSPEDTPGDGTPWSLAFGAAEGLTRRVRSVAGTVPTVGIAVVRGRSMEPTYHDGDRLLVAWGLSPRPGRAAVVSLPPGPDGPRPLAVKRVTGRDPADPARWWVERDNDAVGVDSWTVGSLASEDIRGLVLTRIPEVSLPGGRRAQAAALAALVWKATRGLRERREASRPPTQRGKLD